MNSLRTFVNTTFHDVEPLVTPTQRLNESTWDEYVLHEPLDKGAFGTVHAAMHRVQGQRVAIKHMTAHKHNMSRIGHELTTLELIAKSPAHVSLLHQK